MAASSACLAAPQEEAAVVVVLRLAMAATVLARLHPCRLTLKGVASVAKRFPNFWPQAAQAQVRVEAWSGG